MLFYLIIYLSSINLILTVFITFFFQKNWFFNMLTLFQNFFFFKISLLISFFSLAGIPPFIGFFLKINVFCFFFFLNFFWFFFLISFLLLGFLYFYLINIRYLLIDYQAFSGFIKPFLTFESYDFFFGLLIYLNLLVFGINYYFWLILYFKWLII